MLKSCGMLPKWPEHRMQPVQTSEPALSAQGTKQTAQTRHAPCDKVAMLGCLLTGHACSDQRV